MKKYKNFKKDETHLLKALRELVKNNIDQADINPDLDSEVSGLIIDIMDKRRLRDLRALGIALDKFIEKHEGLEKLKINERIYNERARLNHEALVEMRINDHQ